MSPHLSCCIIRSHRATVTACMQTVANCEEISRQALQWHSENVQSHRGNYRLEHAPLKLPRGLTDKYAHVQAACSWILQPATHNDYDGYSIYTDPSRYPHDPKPIQPIPSPNHLRRWQLHRGGWEKNFSCLEHSMHSRGRLAEQTQVDNIKKRCMSAQGAISCAFLSSELCVNKLSKPQQSPSEISSSQPPGKCWTANLMRTGLLGRHLVPGLLRTTDPCPIQH